MSGHRAQEELEQLALGALPAAAAAEALAHVAACAGCARELSWLRAERALLARRAAAQPALPPALWQGIEARLIEARLREEAARADSGSLPADKAPLHTDKARLHTDRARLHADESRVQAGKLRPLAFPQALPRRARRLVGFAAVAVSAAAVLLFGAPRVAHGPAGLSAGAPDAAQEETDPDVPDVKVQTALDRAEHDYKQAVNVLEAEVSTQREKLGRLDPAAVQRFDASLLRARKTRQGLDDAQASAAGDVHARVRVLGGYAAYLRSLNDIVKDSEEAAP